MGIQKDTDLNGYSERYVMAYMGIQKDTSWPTWVFRKIRHGLHGYSERYGMAYMGIQKDTS